MSGLFIAFLPAHRDHWHSLNTGILRSPLNKIVKEMQGFEERLGSSFPKFFLSTCMVCSARWGLGAGSVTKPLFLDMPEPGSHAAPRLPGAPLLKLLEEGRREKGRGGVPAFFLSWSSSPPSPRHFSTAAAPFRQIGTPEGRATSSLAHVEFFPQMCK